MPQYCYCCNCTDEKLSPWTHPQHQKDLLFCGFCLRTIIGACSQCGAVIYNLEQYTIENDNSMRCSECSYVQYLKEEGAL